MKIITPKLGVYGPMVPIHSERIAEALGAEYIRQNDIHHDSTVLLCPYPHPSMKDYVTRARKRGSKIIAYWIGGDSMNASNNMFYKNGLPEFDHHLACHDRLILTLGKAYIDAKLLGYFGDVQSIADPVSKPCVGMYTPSTNPRYGFKEALELAEALPDMDFLFYGSDALPELPKNIENLGRLSPDKIRGVYERISVLLRITYHDGHPQNMIEAKMAGRHVITSYPYDGCLYAQTLEQVKHWLNDPMTHQNDKTMWPERYRDLYTPTLFKTRFQEAYASLTH